MLGEKFEILEEQNIMTVDRAIQLINEYIVKMGNEAEETLRPVEYHDLINNHKLCEILIDFLGDIYICHGIDANCRDNHFGDQVQQLITFLASIVSEELC